MFLVFFFFLLAKSQKRQVKLFIDVEGPSNFETELSYGQLLFREPGGVCKQPKQRWRRCVKVEENEKRADQNTGYVRSY